MGSDTVEKKKNNSIYNSKNTTNNTAPPRYDNIEYSDDWESVPVVRAEPVSTYSEYDDLQNDEMLEQEIYKRAIKKDKKKKENQNPQPVLKLQIILALLLLATAFLLKSFGGDIYTIAKEWYFTNLNNSIVASVVEDTK